MISTNWLTTVWAGVLTGLVSFVIWTGAAPARAEEKRVALLIGNQTYDASVGALKNPHKDVALMAAALKQQGFEILPILLDAKRTDILGAVRGLAAKLRLAGGNAVGFLYYSGHGAAEKDTNLNYLIPVDARDPGTFAFWDASLKLDDIMSLLDTARGAVKFVVFDACRNELQLPTRDTSKGLLPVAEQHGYFVAYASAPGRTASDRGALSGPYAAALAKELGKPGLDHLNLFQNVKERVIASTGGAQHPWESNGLSRRIYLTGEPTIKADIARWDGVRNSNDVAKLKAYLTEFPKGLFAATAEQMINRLLKEAAQRDADRAAEAGRERLKAEQAEELRKAVADAQQARQAMAAAETRRAEAERAAQAALAQRAAGAQTTAKDAANQGAAQSVKSAEAAKAAKAAKAADAARREQVAAEVARATRTAFAAAEARIKAAEEKLAALEMSRKANPPASPVAEDPARVAVLPKPADPRPRDKFDGNWFVSVSSKTCRRRSGRFRMYIEGRSITVYRRAGRSTGTISADGKFRYVMPAMTDGSPIDVTGSLTADHGSGSYRLRDGRCGGVMSIKRE